MKSTRPRKKTKNDLIVLLKTLTYFCWNQELLVTIAQREPETTGNTKIDPGLDINKI